MTTHTLTVPEKLRLRSAFSRWQRNPKFFAAEIAQAQQALNDAEQYGWKITVDKFGVPKSLPAENMRLTSRELSRFQKRFATMDQDELTQARAALVAIGTRGYTARVNSCGMLEAVPPGAKAKRIIHGDNLSSTKQKKFYNRFFPSTVTAKA